MEYPKRGELRHTVLLAARQGTSDADGDVQEYATKYIPVRAKIEPVGTMIFLQGANAGHDAITHRIFINWINPAELDLDTVAIRNREARDGSGITEQYSIRRAAEINGRNRYLVLEVVFERMETTNTERMV